MRRTGFQRVATLGLHKALPRNPHILPGLQQASKAFRASTDSLVARFCPEKTDLKDSALRDASWCPEMLSLYQEFLERNQVRFAHGGSLAAMMDETFSKTAYLAGGGLFTLSLNFRFKNLIPVGSLAVLDVQAEKLEDQKLYMSCTAWSRDKLTVYAKSSGVFLQLQLEDEPSQEQ